MVNAITDAIGSEEIAMPATPQVVWAAIRKAKRPRGEVIFVRGPETSDVRFHLSPCQRVAAATNMLGKLEEAKLLAGGQTLLPTMKLRLASPSNIIDLDRVEGFRIG